MRINLRKLRTEKGLTVEELSEKAHVGVGTISRIENHEIRPTVYTICRLCIALHVTICEMVECERDYYDDDEW